jgi:hypothetical protein
MFVQQSPARMGSRAPASGLTPPVNGADFARTAGSFILNRYGQAVVGAGINYMDNTVRDIAASISRKSAIPRKAAAKAGIPGNGSDKGKVNGKDDGSGIPKKPGKEGGWRKKRSMSDKGQYGGIDVSSTPRFGLDTGIESGTILNPLQDTTNYYSPLYIQCGTLLPTIGENDDSTFSELINSELYFRYLIIVQQVITNNFASYFTEVDFFNYLATVSEALQIYYMVDSILAFSSHSDNKNQNLAMVNLRMAIGPDILNGHMKLKEFLESVPIPPNLLQYIRYMYQNFCFKDVKGSSIIRLSYQDSLCTDEYKGSLGIDGNTYNSIVLKMLELSKLGSIIAKIRPNWITDLPPSSYEVFYDPQFSTFWHNSNIAYEDFGSNIVKYTINANSKSDLLYYGIFDDRLDGAIYASCSVNLKTTNKDKSIQQMGMWQPFNSFKNKNSISSSLLYFNKESKVSSILDVAYRNASMVYAAPHAVKTESGNFTWVVNASNFAGSTIPQVHTLENTTQAVVRTVNWLFEPK